MFGELWLITALVTVVAALLIARRQALKDNETFWSPPTRRVALALVPPLLAGMFVGTIPASTNGGNEDALIAAIILDIVSMAARSPSCRGLFHASRDQGFWLALYLQRLRPVIGVRQGVATFSYSSPRVDGLFLQGVLHLAYGLYLYLTEKRDAGGNERGKESGVESGTFSPARPCDSPRERAAGDHVHARRLAGPLASTELRDTLGMTDGNLTTHLNALQQAGYLAVAKS